MRLRDFTDEDLDAVRSIAGRRWDPERRMWLLPDTPESRAALSEAFGSRLVLGEPRDPPDEAPDEPPAGPRPRRPRDAAGSVAARGDLLDALSRAIRTRNYSPKTERAYVGWVRRFLRFHGTDPRHGTARLDPAHGAAFLEHLAIEGRLGAMTRNQAASALAFLFRDVLNREGFDQVPRAKGPRRLPTVLSSREVLAVLRELPQTHRLIVSLLYSAGLRVEECLRMRVKDVDFELRQILVRDGKGRKDRYVPLAHRAVEALRARIRLRSEQHEEDRKRGRAWAPLPDALARKDRRAGYEIAWQFVFPSRAIKTDPVTGRRGRGPLHPSAVQRQVKLAALRSKTGKRVTCHTFRHSFATEALRGGCDIRTLQHVLGHKDVRTTMVYLHVVEQTGLHIRSPLDRPTEPGDPDWEEGPAADPLPPRAQR